MKYGWNDNNWNKEIEGTRFADAVVMFNLDGFLGMMKRKTYKEADEKALKALKEMTAMIEKHMEEIKKA